VTRETILHFDCPLAADTLLTLDRLHAEAGGRRLLGRVELSSDRRTVTLFHLEPLPGSSRVTVSFDSNNLLDQVGAPVDGDRDGQPGGVGVWSFDTLSTTPLAGTVVVGRVFAAELVAGPDTGTNAVNRPLEGVTITVDGREQDLRATTDAAGYFRLAPVPPGRFFVHIDGRTAKGSDYPHGAFYPTVGKAWDALAGRTNLAGGTGEIYLPLIRPGTLQPVSVVADTTVTFPPEVVAATPALAGVSVTVPANSLFADDGTRGGRVGIAPVPPDRLPGPLPPGLEFPLVITVQTDGPPELRPARARLFSQPARPDDGQAATRRQPAGLDLVQPPQRHLGSRRRDDRQCGRPDDLHRPGLGHFAARLARRGAGPQETQVRSRKGMLRQAGTTPSARPAGRESGRRRPPRGPAARMRRALPARSREAQRVLCSLQGCVGRVRDPRLHDLPADPEKRGDH
jgi:hypothetical protein